MVRSLGEFKRDARGRREGDGQGEKEQDGSSQTEHTDKDRKVERGPSGDRQNTVQLWFPGKMRPMGSLGVGGLMMVLAWRSADAEVCC